MYVRVVGIVAMLKMVKMREVRKTIKPPVCTTKQQPPDSPPKHTDPTPLWGIARSG